ncbi:MAG: LysR family transcriptional regulator [Sphingomicrobium sp.]
MDLSPFDLNLRHLRSLDAIVERGSMSAAAEAVGLSQPALTQGLAKLEKQIEVVLFERQADGVSPTEAGRVMAERTRAGFAILDAARRGTARRGFARPGQLLTAAQARAFLALVAAGSFVGAAGATGLSQPALHRAVRDLEQIWGQPLVERRGRGVAITTAGSRLARAVRLAGVEIAAGLATIAGDAQRGRIAVGAMPLSRALVLPSALAQFQRGAPRATVDIYEGSWRDLIEPLLDGIIDFTIGALRETAAPGTEQEPLFVDRLTVIGRAGHPLAKVAKPGLGALGAYGWIVGQAGTPLRAHWEAMFDGCPLPANPIECGSVMVIRGVLEKTDLLTLLSPDQVALEIQAGMLARIGGAMAGAERLIGLTVRSGWCPTAAQARLVGLIRAAVQHN